MATAHVGTDGKNIKEKQQEVSEFGATNNMILSKTSVWLKKVLGDIESDQNLWTCSDVDYLQKYVTRFEETQLKLKNDHAELMNKIKELQELQREVSVSYKNAEFLQSVVLLEEAVQKSMQREQKKGFWNTYEDPLELLAWRVGLAANESKIENVYDFLPEVRRHAAPTPNV